MAAPLYPAEFAQQTGGRDEQMAALRTAAGKAASGSGQIMSVIGEAGLGKSRLIAELKQELESAGASRALWLEGKSHSYETSSPFTPFRDIFRDHFELDADKSEAQQVEQIKDRINALIAGQGELMAPFFAHMLDLALEQEDAERIKFLQPPELRATLFAHVKSVLEAQLVQGPVVLYIDDLHWIDPTSFALLHDLLSLVQENPLLIITAFRPRRDEPSWSFHETAVRKYPAR
jgi:predicted ATPase